MERNEKVANRIKELSAEFLGRAKHKSSMITVTSCQVSNNIKQAVVYVTVFPADKESAALPFLKRKRALLRDFLKKNMEIKSIPFLDIAIDQGEKNRQKIDELLRNN